MKNIKFLKSIGLMTVFCAFMSFTGAPDKGVFDNTVCASGTVESAEFGTMDVTICYTGPEIGFALAAKLRAKIADFRAEVAE